MTVRSRPTRKPIAYQLKRTLTLLTALLLAPLPALHAAEFHVAPTGDDANPGTEAAPLATIQAGVNKLQPGDTLIVHGGVYRETVTFPRSGTAEKPITVKASPDQKVVITGCDPVSGWTVHDAAKNIWKAPMAWTLGTGRNQVFLGGEVLIEARFPNQPSPGLEMPVSGLSKLWPTFGEFSIPEPAKRPERVLSKLLDGLPVDYWKGAIYYGVHYGAYSAQTGIVSGSKDGELTVDDRTRQWWCVDPINCVDDGRGMLVGHMNALDQPGEWHWQDKALYLIPPSGEKPADVEAKRRQLAFDLSGREHIRIEGIAVRAASARLQDSAQCVFDRCRFEYVSHFTRHYAIGQIEPTGDNMKSGETGIFVGGHDNAFLNCTVRFSAGAGFHLRGYHHTIHNCLIDEVSYTSHYLNAITDAVADFADYENFLAGGHAITFNTMRNAGRHFFNFYGNGTSTASRNRGPMDYAATLFAHNYLYNGMLQTRDAGFLTGYYASGGTLNGQNSQVLFNVLHDCYDPWAMELDVLGIIYLDAGTCDVTLHHNLLWAAPGSLQRGLYYNTACVDIREHNNVFHKEFTRTCADLKPEDFPEGKPFRFGHDFQNPPAVPHWPQIERQRIEAESSATMSAGVSKTATGLMGLKDGDWFAFDGVDLSAGWQSMVMRFAGDDKAMNTGRAGRTPPRHRKATDPLVLEVVAKNGASPEVRTHWTFCHNVTDGAWLKYEQVPLGEGYRRFRVIYGNTSDSPRHLEVRLDRVDGPLAGRVALPRTDKPRGGAIQVYQEAVGELVPDATGTRDVFLVFHSEDKKLVGEFEYFRFEQYRGQIPLQKNEVKIEVRAGGKDGEKLGEFYPRYTGGTDVFREMVATLEPSKLTGPQRLFLLVRAAEMRNWQLSSGLAGEVRDGVFQGKILEPLDPFLFFEAGGASLQGAPSVCIRLKVSGPASAVIYFGTKAEPGFSDDKKSAGFTLIGDGQWHEYKVEIKHPKWTGELAAIRLDFDRAAADAQVAVDCIRLTLGGKDVAAFDFKPRTNSEPLVTADWLSLEKAKEPMDMTGLGIEPLKRDGQFVFPEPTHRPLPPDIRRLPSRLRQKLEAQKK